jgi:hypothetical protein
VERADVTDEEIAQAVQEALRQARARAQHGAIPPAAPLPVLPEPAAVPPPPQGPATTATLAAGLPYEGDTDPDGDRPIWTLLPQTLLWTPPRANPLQPRFAVIPNSLREPGIVRTIDTAIGGTAGLWRRSPAGRPEEGTELDLFAVVLSRWSDNSVSVANDFRFGFPVTYRYGPWEGKVAYEHTSTHLGDDYIERDHGVKHGHIRDEFVLGLSYRLWDRLRFYGVFGYSVYMTSPAGRDLKDRYDVGIEYEKRGPTGWVGHPFAAADLEIRADQNYTGNFTAQLGWQWKPETERPSLRTVLQYYDGRSPFGQFFLRHEDWVGAALIIDY